MKATEWTEAFASGKMDDKLSLLYGNAKATLEQQRQRRHDHRSYCSVPLRSQHSG